MLDGLPDELFDELLGDEKEASSTAKKENVTPKRKAYLVVQEKMRLKAFADVFMSTAQDYWKQFYESTVQPMQEGICGSVHKLLDEAIKAANEEDEDEDNHIFRPSAKFIISLAKSRSKIVYGLRSIRKSISAIKRLWEKHDIQKVLLDEREKRRFIEDFREAAADIFDPIVFYIKTQILEIMSWIWTAIAPMATILAKTLVKAGILAARVAGKVKKIARWSFRGVQYLLNKTGITALGKSVLNYIGATRVGGVVVRTTRSAEALFASLGQSSKLATVTRAFSVATKAGKFALSGATKLLRMPGIGTAASVFIDYLYSDDFSDALRKNKYALIGLAVGAGAGALVGGVAGAAAGGVGAVPGAIAGAKWGALAGELVGSGIDYVVALKNEAQDAMNWLNDNLEGIIQSMEAMTSGHMSKLPALEMIAQVSIKTERMLNKGGKPDSDLYDSEILASSDSLIIKSFLAYKKVVLNFLSKVQKVRVSWKQKGTDENFNWVEVLNNALTFKRSIEFFKTQEDRKRDWNIKTSIMASQGWVRLPQRWANSFWGKPRVKRAFKLIDSTIEKINSLKASSSTLEKLSQMVASKIQAQKDMARRLFDKLNITINLRRTATYIHREEDVSKTRMIALSVQEVKDSDGDKKFKFFLNGRPVLTERPAELWGMSLFWNTDDYEVKDDGKMQNLDIFGGKAFEGNAPSFNDNEADKLEKSKRKTALLQRVESEFAAYYTTVCA